MRRKRRFAQNELLALLLIFVLSSCASPSSLEHNNNNATTATNFDAGIVSTTTTTSKKQTLRDVSSSYRELLGRLDMIAHLERAKAVLTYDRMIFMPLAASKDRGDQLNAMASVIHKQSTDPILRKLILRAMSDYSAADHDDVVNDPDAGRLLELELKAFQDKVHVPSHVAQRIAALSTEAYESWIYARKQNDYASFAPTLAECFEVCKQRAIARRGQDDEPSDSDVYTRLLDEFEVGMSQERIDTMFTKIQNALVPLIQRVRSSSYQPRTTPLKGATVDVEKQKQVYTDIIASIGFNTTAGRIDTAIHPFTTSFGSNDVRVTSRFHQNHWYHGLAAILHEAGHAIYEQNLGRSLGSSQYSIDNSLSMGTHESQALFWERQIGHSKSFWKWILPKLREAFPNLAVFQTSTAEQMYEAVNAVASAHVLRVEADELTYPLHIIMRYEIEKQVIDGSLAVEDIPKRWKSDMKSLLNVDVPKKDNNNDDDHKYGCLQDVHWATMSIGYFPTYLIGSAAAAQLAYYCRMDIPDMEERIENGDFEPIRRWLTDKVHRHGSRYVSLDAMFQDQLGEALNPQYFVNYLTEKYSRLYRLDSSE